MRRAAQVLAALGLAGSALLTVSTRVGAPSWLFSVLSVAAPLSVVGYALVALLLLLARSRGTVLVAGLALCGVGAGLQVAWVAPRYVADDRAVSRSRPALTVMTANLHLGRADAGSVVRAVRRDGVDVLVLAEVTPSLLARMTSRGLDDLLPHRTGEARPADKGVMVLSRWPLSRAVSVPVLHGGLSTVVRADRPFALLAVHPGDALFHQRRWYADLDRIRSLVRDARADRPDGSVLVAGDLNSTLDQAHLRRVLDVGGLRDAAEQAGSGLAPTWPAGRSVPPAITIDHVLAGAAYEALDTDRVRIPGSDHLALVAHLVARGGGRG